MLHIVIWGIECLNFCIKSTSKDTQSIIPGTIATTMAVCVSNCCLQFQPEGWEIANKCKATK